MSEQNAAAAARRTKHPKRTQRQSNGHSVAHIAERRQRLEQLLEQNPRATLRDLAQMLGGGIVISTVHSDLRALEIPTNDNERIELYAYAAGFTAGWDASARAQGNPDA